jgi:hypothetical protein
VAAGDVGADAEESIQTLLRFSPRLIGGSSSRSPLSVAVMTGEVTKGEEGIL